MQAQESVATANDQLISALYAHNVGQSRAGAGPGRRRAGNTKISGGEVAWQNLRHEPIVRRERRRPSGRWVIAVVVVAGAVVRRILLVAISGHIRSHRRRADRRPYQCRQRRIAGNVIEIRAEDEQYREGRRCSGAAGSARLRCGPGQGAGGFGRRRSHARKLAHRCSHHDDQYREPIENRAFVAGRRNGVRCWARSAS